MQTEYEERIKSYNLEGVSSLYTTYNNSIAVNDDSIVYHYTSFTALKGILEDQRLWLSNFSTTNDTSEVIHGINEIKEIITNNSQIHRSITDYFLILFEKNILQNYIIGVLSFILDKKDYLPMWRCYGNNGAGFTIGFSIKQLAESFDKQEDQTWITTNYPVTYDITDELKGYIINLWNIFQKRIQTCKTSAETDNTFRDVAPILQAYLFALLPHIKHDAYKEEHEYRIIMTNSKPKFTINENPNDAMRGYFLRKNFRETNDFANPIPTIITERFPKNCINSIGIGPCCNEELARHELKKLLHDFGYEHEIEIYHSSIPYRG